MVSSIYNHLIPFEEVGGNMPERLGLLGIHDIFEPLVAEYGHDGSFFNQVLFYIVHAYSRDSEYHIQYVDWTEIKKVVAIKVGFDLEDETVQDILHLRNKAFTQCIRKYMDYQGSKAFKHLVMLKDLYEQMVNSSIENIMRSDDTVDWDQKMKNAGHAEKLYEQIGTWEQRIKEENVKLNKPLTELQTVEKTKKENFSLRVEDNLQ